MMKGFRVAAILAIAASAVLLSACYEEPTVQLHEPGKYQGATDPFLNVAGTPEQNARLESRFLAVQTDR